MILFVSNVQMELLWLMADANRALLTAQTVPLEKTHSAMTVYKAMGSATILAGHAQEDAYTVTLQTIHLTANGVLRAFMLIRMERVTDVKMDAISAKVKLTALIMKME